MKIIKNKESQNSILFYLVSLISIFGTAIYTFAMSLYVLKVTGSSLSFSSTLILSILPIVFLNPFVGVIVDKYNKKKLVILANILNGIFLLGVYIISAFNGISIGIIYLSTFVISSINIIFDVSIDSSIPNIVSKEKIVSINAGNRIIDSISSILGPVLGGIVFVIFDIKTFILFNSISFFISSILDWKIDFNLFKSNSSDNDRVINKNYFIEIKEGFKYLISKKSIKDFIIIFIIYNFFISFSISIPMPIILNNIFMMPEKNYGFIQSGVPIGMIIGAIIIKKIINKLKLNNLLSLIGTLMAIEIILLAIPLIGKINSYNINYLSVYYFFIMMFIGICISLVDIPFSYSIQTDIEEGYRGRVLSLTISLVKTVVPISYLASGLLLDKVNPLIIVLFGGIAILIVSVSYYKFKIVE
ncbi:MFS transporter [Clostridium sp. HCS.1]|uniref:MFS transporter n=1 Tax=Clostridium sp. HCS.1 TaxID=3238594 RepID=UPI003A0FFC21